MRQVSVPALMHVEEISVQIPAAFGFYLTNNRDDWMTSCCEDTDKS